MIKVGFIGCGNMGSAIAHAVYKTNNVQLSIYDPSPASKELTSDIKADYTDAEVIYKNCDFIFLAVKPNLIDGVLTDAQSILCSRNDFVLVSMAAGVKLEKYYSFLPTAHIIRIMPNTPVQVGEGMIEYCSYNTSEKDLSDFKDIMKYSGVIDEIPEKLIDAASAVAGCGPAFAYMFAEALADGAVACGLPRDKALVYASQMLKGSAEMLLNTGIHPGKLKDNVCSPGGSTIQGVRALEDNGFRAAAVEAVIASYEKTLDLGK